MKKNQTASFRLWVFHLEDDSLWESEDRRYLRHMARRYGWLSVFRKQFGEIIPDYDDDNIDLVP